ncbi:ABC transporter permease [Halorubrum sp. GN11_10-6_MGM]|uniref:ABC transporter permease n=1 Tax=Halorubrum sp. GN11_10-6_MGM TaxID=2518112 RepID=UPI0010F85D7C|nr:ABC transporter permease [Halorubrum sp. GN11_10-6_MGM]TKX73586.1 ABC transporter permease [Halorubrum sp. GN11_10-6_MGM]
MRSDDDPPRFEDIDWDDVERSRGLATPERATLLGGATLVAGLFAFHRTSADPFLVGRWQPAPIDWVFAAAAVLLAAYGVVPLARRVDPPDSWLGAVRSRPAPTAAAAFLLALLVVGVFAPVVGETPPLRFQHAFHPPVGFASAVPPQECLGTVTGGPFDSVCHGSWEYPLGTNERGHPLGYLLVEGARVATYLLVISAAFIVPLAAAVGVVAGFRGGRVDDLLSAYVDVQLSLPAVLLYFVGYTYYGPSLFLLLATFGLLSWGGIARLVRSEVIQRREDGYVLVARSLGASEWDVARRHVLPNSTNTLVPAGFQLLALFVLIEAGIAFLGFHDVETYSWGSTISEATNAAVAGQLQSRADVPAADVWWVSTLPALALTATVFALKTLGDGIRDALDPRGGR